MTEGTAGFEIAFCGLVCTNCGAMKKGKCRGCHSERPMNRNCRMKACAISKDLTICSDCGEFENLRDCRKLNNLVSKFFSMIFHTDRIGNLNRIREIGLEEFRKEREADGKM